MKRCSMCQEVKPLWAFGVREDGRVRAQCRACHAASHKEQQSTTPETLLARAILRDRLGDMVNGCVIPAQGVGSEPDVCPWYWHCRKLTSEEPVVCEVSDTELGIPAIKEGPQKPEPEYPWWVAP